MAKTRKQLSSPLFLGEMESLYQRSQMKPQAKFVGGVVVEQDYSTFMILSIVFIYLLLPQSITLKGCSKTKKPSFTNACWKYFEQKSDLWYF